MILSDKRILEEMDKGTIRIVPYSRDCLGSNSYDVHLGKWIANYADIELDAKKHNKINTFEIPDSGVLLFPHIPRRMRMCPSWKENRPPGGWGSISMPLRARATWVSAGTGRWRSPLNSQ